MTKEDEDSKGGYYMSPLAGIQYKLYRGSFAQASQVPRSFFLLFLPL